MRGVVGATDNSDVIAAELAASLCACVDTNEASDVVDAAFIADVVVVVAVCRSRTKRQITII